MTKNTNYCRYNNIGLCEYARVLFSEICTREMTTSYGHLKLLCTNIPSISVMCFLKSNSHNSFFFSTIVNVNDLTS